MARYTKTGTPSTIGELNAQLDLIALAINDTFSRVGDSPNQLETSLDMNSNRLLNLPIPSLDNDPVRRIDVLNAEGGTETGLLRTDLANGAADIGKYSSVASLVAKTTQFVVGATVSSPLTKWIITTSATYTLPDQSRSSRVFNSLALSNGQYAVPAESNIYASDFLDESVTANNDTAVGLMTSIMRDGSRLDFSGKMFRVFATVAGIASSTATPATSVAHPLSLILSPTDLHNITFGAGGLYAANQSTSATKKYYPSTLFIKNCFNVHFEQGSTFESKGESFGDSDASFTLSTTARQDFLGENGGHAIVIVRCKTVTGSPTARFAGSVGPLYFSSCDDVRLVNPFSNSASLGYASYSFDAWVGSLAEVGFDTFLANISNPVAYSELILRREDGVQAGSSLYCGKGGVLTEDTGVVTNTQGGYIADMYANGGARTLGYAFGAGVHSLCTNVGAVVRNCQEVVYVNVSAAGTSECRVTEVDAIVGLTGIMFDNQPFGVCRATLKGKVRVNNSRTWSGQTETLANTSLVASMKPASSSFAIVDCDAGADLEAASGGILFTLVSNTNEATFGSVIFEGGNYLTNGYIMRSQGWGSSQAGAAPNLFMKEGVVIKDLSSAATDGLIQYKNQSDVGNVFTYINHDLEGAKISANGFRALDSGYVITGGTGLLEKILFPRKAGITTYVLTRNFRPKETLNVQFTQTNGLSSANSLMDFVMSDGRGLRTPCFITSDVGLLKVLSVQSVSVAGPLRSVVRLEGDVRTDFTAGVNYTVLGG
jgi:hypothetical protein